MPEDLWTVPGNIISHLSLADRLDWRDTRENWPLDRNPDRGWWDRHINLKLFFPPLKAALTAGLMTKIVWYFIALVEH